MKERPIIFNGAMVRAILSGQKTQTRRICMPMQQWVNQDCREVRLYEGEPHHFLKGAEAPIGRLTCPFGQPGDRLWVRETFGYVSPDEHERPHSECNIEYRADLPPGCTDRPGNWPAEECADDPARPRWRPSIHMPRNAARIFLEITDVRVERLASISENDSVAEGMTFTDYGLDQFGRKRPGWLWRQSSRHDECLSSARWAFGNLWVDVYGQESWDGNPWVWVVEFKSAAREGEV